MKVKLLLKDERGIGNIVILVGLIPILALLIFLGIRYSNMADVANVVEEAAQTGARWLATHPGDIQGARVKAAQVVEGSFTAVQGINVNVDLSAWNLRGLLTKSGTWYYIDQTQCFPANSGIRAEMDSALDREILAQGTLITANLFNASTVTTDPPETQTVNETGGGGGYHTVTQTSWGITGYVQQYQPGYWYQVPQYGWVWGVVGYIDEYQPGYWYEVPQYGWVWGITGYVQQWVPAYGYWVDQWDYVYVPGHWESVPQYGWVWGITGYAWQYQPGYWHQVPQYGWVWGITGYTWQYQPGYWYNAPQYGWVTQSFQVRSTDSCNYSNGVSIPKYMEKSAAYMIQATVTNNGSETWTAGSSFALSYHWLDQNGNAVIWDGNRAYVQSNVPPNGSYTFNLQVTAPSSPGSYILELDMVHEGVTWFSDPSTSDSPVVKANVTVPSGTVLKGFLDYDGLNYWVGNTVIQPQNGIDLMPYVGKNVILWGSSAGQSFNVYKITAVEAYVPTDYTATSTFDPNADVILTEKDGYATCTVTYHYPIFLRNLLAFLHGGQSPPSNAITGTATFKLETGL